MKSDFIIVGQGLAGSLLSYELLKRGQKVAVIDSPDYRKASEVAAGLVNPVVFRRLTRSWLVDDLYPQLASTFAELEELLGCRIFYPMKIRKVFGSGEASFWQKKVADNELAEYLNAAPDFTRYPELKLEQGSGWVEKAGRVDLETFLAAYRSWLKAKCLLYELNFEYERMILHPGRVVYGPLEGRKLIFCEGYRASQNPFFQQIQFKHTKGEVLNLVADRYRADFILNKAFFLMPTGGGEFRLGATYDWDNLDEEPTEAARDELTGKLEQVFNGHYRISGQRAGIRPTTHDRRPVAGLHPDHPQLGIFNGLGSKGCMLAPYFSRQLAAHLINPSVPLHPQVDLRRYC
ncbi:FAD-binding oxidoreductase [Mangrovibacterium marinum]|uniref:Glycine/D-amino acid oxidase-like deaminating enzyme n=1 Tax=Mangrovibacterium marinum TaxID=1639118 RepID=A0A2T5C583_9BACT|nr:FAD-dependent oxidoreductase [Mangrovibacterium marinum]PTN10067.1 glycine/D-amino acid oxidase-like deaminating enzyme [Mangrovibacterium marinum]